MTGRRNLQPEVRIVEVGPRDGLQNERWRIPTDVKVAFVDALSASGLTTIEATSFVSPEAVPQLADAAEVMASIDRHPGIRYPVLVPNERGLERALDSGVDSIALFTSATEAFCEANIGCSIDESLARFGRVLARAKPAGLWIRGYVSVAFACPYSGPVRPEAGIAVALRLLKLGCDEICIADTIGSATPQEVGAFFEASSGQLPFAATALHVHDTHGQAVGNVAVAYDAGIRVFDGAAGGLGGCPFAPGAAGNVTTEALLAFFASRGIATGVDSHAIESAVDALRHHLRPPGAIDGEAR